MLNDKLSVVIVCYDPYKDAIQLNPYFFSENWGSCTANVIYVTSFEDVPTEHTVLKTNGDLSFFGRLKKALSFIKTEYVLLLLDDYLIDKRINESLLKQNIRFMENNNVHFCELYTMFSTPKGDRIKFENTFFTKISPKRKYRITLQPSIFKKTLLKRLVEFEPKGAWEAELIFMKDEFKEYDAYFSCNKSFSVTNYIDKGLVTRKAYRMLKKNGLWNNQRQVMSLGKTIKKCFVRKMYSIIPQKIKDKIKGNVIIYKG